MAFKFGDAIEIKPAAGRLVPWPEKQPVNKPLTFLGADAWTRATYSPYVANVQAQGDVEARAYVAPAAEPPRTKKGD